MKDYSQDIEAEDYYDMGCEWIKQRNYEKAEECFFHVIALNPRFIYAYISLAEVYARAHDLNEAIRCLRKAVKFDPRFDRVYYCIAKYSFMNEEYKTALTNIEQALDLNPTEDYESMKEVIEEYYLRRRR